MDYNLLTYGTDTQLTPYMITFYTYVAGISLGIYAVFRANFELKQKVIFTPFW